MKLKDCISLCYNKCYLILGGFGFKSKIFDKDEVNQASRILNCKVIGFWADFIEGKPVHCIKIECKNLNDIKDFFK